MTPDLVAAAVRLAETLTAENRALAALDLPRAAALFSDKQRAVAAFDAATLLAGRGLAPDRRAEAEALAARLRDLAQQNRRLLERAIGVQSEVIATVARAMPRPAPNGYSARGSFATAASPVAQALSARA